MIGGRPPELLQIGPLTLYTYAVCILAGIAGGYVIARPAARRLGLTTEALQASLVYGVLPGVVGARLYHVVDYSAFYGAHPAEIIAIWHGGLAIIGGLAGGVIGLWFFARRHGVPLLRVLDVWAPGVLFAQAIGRLGNWANQEAFGPATGLPWAVAIDPDHRPAGSPTTAGYHPTFFYELIWDLAALAVILAFRRKFELTPGRTLGAYLVAYGSGRFLAEFFRFDTAQLAGLRVAHVVALVLVAGGLYLLFRPADVKRRAAGSTPPSPGSRPGTGSRRSTGR